LFFSVLSFPYCISALTSLVPKQLIRASNQTIHALPDGRTPLNAGYCFITFPVRFFVRGYMTLGETITERVVSGWIMDVVFVRLRKTRWTL
jgi:hypothetical protein